MSDDAADLKPKPDVDAAGARVEAAVRESETRILAALAAAVATIRQSGQAESDRVFAQLEALLWLRDELELDWPLPPTRGWAAHPTCSLR